MKKLYIPPYPVEQLVEMILHNHIDISDVNHVEYTARIDHGDSQLFSIDAYVVRGDGTSEKLEVTLSIDIKVRNDN